MRDLLYGRPSRDVDLAVAGDATALARQCADSQGAHLATLAPNIARVVFPTLGFHIDFVTLQGATLEDDLARRDFTINAMALPCNAATLRATLAGESIDRAMAIDPFGGQADIAARTLRVVRPDALTDDPVRVLRAARFAAHLDLTLAGETLRGAQLATTLLEGTAPERLVAELCAIFAQPHGTRAMRLLDEMGALTALVPPLEACRGVKQGFLHYWDVLQHTLEVIDSLDRVVVLLETGRNGATQPLPDAEGHVEHPAAIDLWGHNDDVLQRLHERSLEGQARLVMLKLATLFHDIGKPQTAVEIAPDDFRFPGHPEAGVPLAQPVLKAWRLGQKARRYIEAVVACHMRPGQMTGPDGLAGSAPRLFFRDAGSAGLDIAIFSLADHLAVYGPTPLTGFWLRHHAAVAEIVRRYYEEPDLLMPPRLIDGKDLMVRYGIAGGAQIGRLLALVREAQLDGAVATRDEALALVTQALATGDTASQ